MNAIADMTATRTAVLDEAHAGHIQGIASREALFVGSAGPALRICSSSAASP